MKRFEGVRLRHTILVPPEKEYTSVDDLARHNFIRVPDKEKSLQQHLALRTMLADMGVKISCIPELEGHPNSVFVRDVALCCPDGAVILRMGLDSRKGEEMWIRTAFERLDIPVIGGVEAPGTIEGGDIILAGAMAFVGSSVRSNKLGVDQATRLLLYMGYRVRIIPVPEPFLHLGGAMSALAPGKILCCEGVFPPHLLQGIDFISIQQKDFVSGNVITVKENQVIADASNAAVIEALQKNGVDVRTIDLSTFVDGAGGPSCLILPVDVE